MPLTPGVRRMSNLDPLTAKQLRDAERDSVYIFNVSPWEYRVPLNRQYVIPACTNGDVSEPLVIPGYVYSTKVKRVNGLDAEYEWHHDDGIDVAKDIIGTGPFKDQSQNLTSQGVFLSMTANPSEEEKSRARALFMETCGKKVAEWDKLFALNQGMVDIGNGRVASNIPTAEAIEVVKILGLKRPYASNNAAMKVCDDCGESNMPTAVRCKNAECRAIFDEAKARQRFPEMFAHERRGPGRPKAEEAVA